MFTSLFKFVSFAVTIISLGALAAIGLVFYLVVHYSKDLPDYSQLAVYDPPTITRLYAADGRLISEYAKEKRLFVPIKAIPKRLVNAFIAAEDKNFYHHPGVDIMSILRAAIQNVTNYGQNKALVGGSTITQQVVKNFLLTNERSLSRKIKEAILAFRITQAFSKERILELYLNEIYLGNRSYGVAAAALNYFNKSIDELKVEEVAMLAALPKAPSHLDPYRNQERARDRRNWVIDRMEEERYIDEVEAILAKATPITLATRDATEIVEADFFSEAVRTELNDRYGEDFVYESGLAVHTTLEPNLQGYARTSLKQGLLEYDKRHGWRDPISKIDLKKQSNWQEALQGVVPPKALDTWKLAVVLGTNSKVARIGLADGTVGTIPVKHLEWARKYISINAIGSKITKPSEVLRKGDVVAVSIVEGSGGDGTTYALEQIPEINGSIICIDAHTGRIKAMVGGYYYGDSQFNRAIQAKRQPGSSFKPFVYLAALENGFTPNSIIVDEEIQLEQGDDQPEWRPQNYSGEYYGPTTLRVGIEKSRNAMTVRLAHLMGIDKVVEIAKRFNITPKPERNFSLALGSAETTLLDLTNAYAPLVNGGKNIKPYMIERIQDRRGKAMFKSDMRECSDCAVTIDPEIADMPVQGPQIPPIVLDNREQIVDPVYAYQMVSMLRGVIDRGTGRKAKSLGKTLAGKTGTTNDSIDAWFIGFSADLVVGVYVGFDNPTTLGKKETGASAALPIWMNFLKDALADRPDTPFRKPSGVKLVKIDATTGLLPDPSTPKSNLIFEAFKNGTEPKTSYAAEEETGIDSDGEVYELESGEIY